MSLIIYNQHNPNKLKRYSDFYFGHNYENFIYIDTRGLIFNKTHPEFQRIMIEEFNDALREFEKFIK